MTWLALLVLAVLALCWWGSSVVFHPPAMLSSMTVRPEDLGLPYEKASFLTEDGLNLSGWLIPAEVPTERTVLLCHGWGDNKGDLLQRMHFLRARFNLFLFDSRAHGDSEGGFSTIGYLEARDFRAALEFLRNNRPAWTKRLGVYGLSMGAAMSIHGMAHDPGILCAAFEAPFQSFNRVVARFAWNRYRIPSFPLVRLVLLAIRLRLRADPEPYSPIYHIGSLAPRPVFFIAGAKDSLMPLSEVKSLYAAAGQPKDIWVVPEARHSRCQEMGGPEYDRRLLEFFDKNL